MASREQYWPLVGKEIDWIHRQLRRLCVHGADLPDLTQEVLFAVYRQWESYDEARPLRSWLFGFAFRISSDYRRRASYRRPALSLEHEPADHRPERPESKIDVETMRGIAIEALEALDDDQRAIVVLVDFEDEPVPAAAETLEVPLNTAYSRLRRGRERFAEAITRIKLRRGIV